MATFDLDFGISDVEFSMQALDDKADFDMNMKVDFVQTNDHKQLINRFVPNQHNIGAIQDLQDNLDSRIVKSYLTNLEIDDLFNSAMGG